MGYMEVPPEMFWQQRSTYKESSVTSICGRLYCGFWLGLYVFISLLLSSCEFNLCKKWIVLSFLNRALLWKKTKCLRTNCVRLHILGRNIQFAHSSLNFLHQHDLSCSSDIFISNIWSAFEIQEESWHLLKHFYVTEQMSFTMQVHSENILQP